MKQSETIGALSWALSKAQSEMGFAHKDANNPYHSSKYADLASVVDAIKAPFAKYDLAFAQFPINEGNSVGVETILTHKSGEWMSERLLLPMKADKKGAYSPQTAGSAITYARRYGLQSMAGIPSSDDDGQAASTQRKKAVTMEEQALRARTAKMIVAFEELGVPAKRVLQGGELEEIEAHQVAALGVSYKAIQEDPAQAIILFPEVE